MMERYHICFDFHLFKLVLNGVHLNPNNLCEYDGVVQNSFFPFFWLLSDIFQVDVWALGVSAIEMAEVYLVKSLNCLSFWYSFFCFLLHPGLDILLPYCWSWTRCTSAGSVLVETETRCIFAFTGNWTWEPHGSQPTSFLCYCCDTAGTDLSFLFPFFRVFLLGQQCIQWGLALYFN